MFTFTFVVSSLIVSALLALTISNEKSKDNDKKRDSKRNRDFDKNPIQVDKGRSYTDEEA